MVAEQYCPARFAIETGGISRLIIHECAQFLFARHDTKVVRQPAAVRTEIVWIFRTAALRRIPQGRDAIMATTFVSEKLFVCGEVDTNGTAFALNSRHGFSRGLASGSSHEFRLGV